MLSDELKDTYGITVGTNHPQCVEPPNTILKYSNYNRRPNHNCASVYQMKICAVSSDLIISRRPFIFIRGSRYSDPIYFLPCNQCEVHLSDKDNDKANGPHFIWPAFYWSIIRCKDICNNYSSEFIWKSVPFEMAQIVV